MQRGWLVWLALAWPTIAGARIKPFVEQAPPSQRASAATRNLQFSQFPERRAAGRLYDLYCPHTVEANPIVVVAPAADQPLEHGETISHQLVQAGYIVIAVEPPRDGAPYASTIAAVVDAVMRAPHLDAREPGCRHTGVVAAWGIEQGGDAVLAFGRAREAASTPLAAIVAVYPRSSIPALATPTLVIDAAPRTAAGTMLVIEGGEACDLRWYNDPCNDADLRGPVVQRQRAIDLRAERLRVSYERIRVYLRATVDADPAARAAVAAWPPTLVVAPPPRPTVVTTYGTHSLLSVPLLLGGTSLGDNGFAIGFRPELVRARLRESAGQTGGGHGIGVYAEVLRANGTTMSGAGLTYVLYLDGLGLAPSLGVYARDTETGRAVGYGGSLYLGIRTRIDALGYFDFPYGVRIDIKSGAGDASERTIMVTAQLDLAIVGIAAVAFAALLGMDVHN